MDEFERLINEGNMAYKKDDYNKAVICYEDALKLATDENKSKFKSILPMMGRCYRQIGNPSSVIDLATEVKQKFGREFISSVFFDHCCRRLCRYERIWKGSYLRQ